MFTGAHVWDRKISFETRVHVYRNSLYISLLSDPMSHLQKSRSPEKPPSSGSWVGVTHRYRWSYHLPSGFLQMNFDFPVRAPQSFHDVIWRNKLHAVPHLRIWTLEKAARIPNPGSSQTRPKHVDCLFFKSIHRTLGIEPKRGLLSVFCCCRWLNELFIFVMLLIDLMVLFVNVLCRPGIKCTVARRPKC